MGAADQGTAFFLGSLQVFVAILCAYLLEWMSLLWRSPQGKPNPNGNAIEEANPFTRPIALTDAITVQATADLDLRRKCDRLARERHFWRNFYWLEHFERQHLEWKNQCNPWYNNSWVAHQQGWMDQYHCECTNTGSIPCRQKPRPEVVEAALRASNSRSQNCSGDGGCGSSSEGDQPPWASEQTRHMRPGDPPVTGSQSAHNWWVDIDEVIGHETQHATQQEGRTQQSGQSQQDTRTQQDNRAQLDHRATSVSFFPKPSLSSSRKSTKGKRKNVRRKSTQKPRKNQ